MGSLISKLADVCAGAAASAIVSVSVWLRNKEPVLISSHANGHAAAGAEASDESVASTESTLESTDDNKVHVEHAVGELERAIGRLEGRLALQGRETDELRDRLKLSQMVHGELLKQLYDKDQELQRMQVMKLTDSASEADLLRMLRALNEEIEVYASAIVGAFRFGEHTDEPKEALDAVAHNVNQWIGKNLIHLLRVRTAHDNDLIILTFKAFLAEYARWIAAGWCFDNSQDEHFLAMYSEMLEKGELLGSHTAYNQ